MRVLIVFNRRQLQLWELVILFATRGHRFSSHSIGNEVGVCPAFEKKQDKG